MNDTSLMSLESPKRVAEGEPVMKRIKRIGVSMMILWLTSGMPILAAKGGKKSKIPVEEVVQITEIRIEDSINQNSVLAIITVKNVTGDYGGPVDASGTIQGDAYFCGGTVSPDGTGQVPCNGLTTPEPNTVAQIDYYLQSEGVTIPAWGFEEFVVEFPRTDFSGNGEYVFFFQGRLCVVGNASCERQLHAVSAAFVTP